MLNIKLSVVILNVRSYLVHCYAIKRCFINWWTYNGIKTPICLKYIYIFSLLRQIFQQFSLFFWQKTFPVWPVVCSGKSGGPCSGFFDDKSRLLKRPLQEVTLSQWQLIKGLCCCTRVRNSSVHVCVDAEQGWGISSSGCDALFTFAAQLPVCATRCLEEHDESGGFICLFINQSSSCKIERHDCRLKVI